MSRSRMGQFRDRVNIEQNTSKGHDPEEDFTGVDFLTDWPCRIIPVSGNETFQGRMIDADTTYIVEGWHADGVLPNMRCVVTAGLPLGTSLNVRYVHEIPQTDGKPALTQLHCSQIVGF